MGKFSFTSTTPQVPQVQIPQVQSVPTQPVPPTGSDFLKQSIANIPPANYNVPSVPSSEAMPEEQMPEEQVILPSEEPVQEDSGFDLEEGQVAPGTEAYDEIQQRLLEERERQQSIADQLDPSKWENEQTLMDFHDRAVKPTEAGAIVRAALDIGQALNSIETTRYGANAASPVKLNGLTDLKQGLGVDANSAVNSVTTAAALIAPILTGASKTGYGDMSTDAESSNDLSGLEALLEDDGNGPTNLAAVDGGLDKAMVERALGRLVKKIAGIKNPNQNISNEQAGALAVQSLIDSGYYNEDIDPETGKEIVRQSPGLGAVFRENSRGLQRQVTGALAGKTQKVPPTPTEGWYEGKLADIRQGDKKKPGYVATQEMAKAKYNVGKVPKLASPIKGYFAALFGEVFTTHALNPNAQIPVSVASINNLFKVSEEDVQAANSGDETAANVIKQKARNLSTELNDLAEIIVDGSPVYTPYWEDYATHRMYEDPVNFNEQRNKVTRAVMAPVSVGFQPTGEYHKTGVNKYTAEAFVRRIQGKARNKDFNLSPQEKELSFLLTLGRVLDSSAKHDQAQMSSESIIMEDLLRTVTPEFIAQAAAKGRLLRSIAPNSKREIVAAMASPKGLIAKLTPEQTGALNNFLQEADRDDWGYKLQAYLDAAAYLDAKQNNGLFTPRLTVALDMNSAGRAALAMDIGNIDILSRVGLIWDQLIDRVGDFFTNTLPNEKGDPRFYFSTIAQKQGIDAAFGDADFEKGQMFKTLLLKYGGIGVKGNKQFNKDFAKKVLMTTDYGKPAMFHIEEAKDFLKNHPDFRDEAKVFYNGDVEALAKDINEIYKATLNISSAEFQYSMPKKMVRFLQTMGRVPRPEGFWGEPISIGKFGAEPTGAVYQVKNKSGKVRRIQETARMFNPLARANPKVLDHGEHFVPEEGTAAQNQIGPTFGQYRESLIIAETANYINEGRKPENALFISPVFDNFIVDAYSYPFVHFVANNIVTPKVFEWEMPQAFYKDFIKQLKEGINEVDKLDEVLIGPGSKYRGLLVTLDREYKYLDKPASELTEKQKAFKEFLESKASGYVPPSADRPEILKMSPAQFKSAIDKLLKFYNFAKSDPKSMKPTGFEQWMFGEKVKQLRQTALSKLKQYGKEGKVYFFT